MMIYGITGWKNCGKTGLMERLLTHFTALGLRVSTIKHAHHSTDVDQAGTDSHRHRQAGASEVILASRHRVAIMQELRGVDEPSLEELLARLASVDLVLIEGYKGARHPKIEAHRKAAGQPLIALNDITIRAVASDVPLTLDRTVFDTVFDLDDTAAIAAFILLDLERIDEATG